MIKKSIIMAICCALIFTLVACTFATASSNNWKYKLPGGYELTRIHYEKVVFQTSNKTCILGNYVFAVSYNDAYIGLQRIPAGESIDFKHADLTQVEYYLFDVAEEMLHGPFTKEEYLEKCEAFSTGEMSAWKNFYRE